MKKLITTSLLGLLSAQAAPAALCANGAHAAYPAAGAPPIVSSWSASQPSAVPGPDCTGLRSRDFALLISVTGRFADTGSADAVLARLGAVSAMKGMTYWSEKDQRRTVLVTDSAAVDGLGALRKRADFSTADLRAGKPLYFVQRDNRATNEVAYQMQLQMAPTSGSASIENASAVKLYLVTLFAPGDIQTVIALEQIGVGQWGYRSLTGIRRVGVGQVDSYRGSYVNRAIAMFDHVARTR